MPRKPNIKLYKKIIKFANQESKRSPSIRHTYRHDSYRAIQKQLKVSPNTISKAFKYEKRAKRTSKARKKK